MTLPVFPNPISLNQVNVELGLAGTTLISLNQASVRTLAGVPSGAISMNNLHGKSNRVSVVYNITSNTQNFYARLNNTYIPSYIAGKTDVIINISAGVYVFGASAFFYGVEVQFGSAGDTVTINNSGYITGRGGQGGNTTPNGYAGGYPGGNAIGADIGVVNAGVLLTVNNNAGGYIAGGGGGGAGGQNGGGGGGAGGLGGNGGNGGGGILGGVYGSLGSSGSNGGGAPITYGGGGGGSVLPGASTSGGVTIGFGGSAGGAGGGDGFTQPGGLGGGPLQAGGSYFSGNAGAGGGGWGAAGGNSAFDSGGAAGRAVYVGCVISAVNNSGVIYGAVANQ